MSEFEYVVVMVSVVLGLGITQILAATTLVIQQPHRVRADWVHGSWVAYMLVQHFQSWWVIWLFREQMPPLNLITYMVMMGNPVLLYLATSVLLPPRLTRRIDLREHYERVRGWFFFLFGLSALWPLVTLIMLLGRIPLIWPIVLVEFLIPLTGYLFRQRRIHRLLAWIAWLTVLRVIGFELWRIASF